MSDYRIVFLDADTVGDIPELSQFQALGSFTLYPQTQPSQLRERIHNQDIVITNKVPIDAAAIAGANALQLICVAATGMDNIDEAAAKERGIGVKNVVNYSSYSVAQVTVGLLLHLLHRTDYYDDYVKSGRYSRQPLFSHFGHEFWQLQGRQFGIIGLGNIGKQVAKVVEALGAKVVYYSTSGKNLNPSYRHLSLEELLKSSDVVSIHAPLNENTRDLLKYEQLTLMQRHALLINTGRGGIVNEADLVRAIDEEQLRGAAIDVFSQEPLPASHPYLQVRNQQRLLLTPHIGWASVESRTSLVKGVYQNIERFIAERRG